MAIKKPTTMADLGSNPATDPTPTVPADQPAVSEQGNLTDDRPDDAPKYVDLVSPIDGKKATVPESIADSLREVGYTGGKSTRKS
jgi:hypothetical protein